MKILSRKICPRVAYLIEKTEFIKIGVSFLSGILMGLAPIISEMWWIAWFTLVPLWFLLKLENVPFIKISFSWGVAYYGLSLWWLTGYSFNWYNLSFINIIITFIGWLLAVSWGATLVLIWSLIIVLLKRWLRQSKPILFILFGVASWSTLELLYSKSCLHWNYLGWTQSPGNLSILQLSQFSGPITVTIIIVAINGLLAEGFLSFYKKKREINFGIILIITSLVLLVGAHGIGWTILEHPLTTNKKAQVTIGIIQGNVPISNFKLKKWERVADQRYAEGYKQLVYSGVDAVLTPEGAVPPIKKFHKKFYQTVQKYDVPAWVGSFNKIQEHFTNSLFALKGNGEIKDRYDKVKLAPLNEYIPFESILGDFIEWLSSRNYNFIAGSSKQRFETSLGPAIVGICYDSAFAELFRQQAAQGGEFILTASNDNPFRKAMATQHHAHDVMRAIETGRWAVRATKTGYSAIVDPRGRTLWRSSLNKYTTHVDTIYQRQTKTLYVYCGNWLIWGCWIIATIHLFYTSKDSGKRIDKDRK